MIRPSFVVPMLLAALTVAAPLPQSRLLAAGSIDTREPGVVCDSIEQLCYNGSGLALDATRRSFGRYGETKARRLIEKGERGRTFKLSNGVACDVAVRTCWDDGWKRRNVSNAMTRHLFSGGSQGWNNSWSDGGSGYSGECLVRRRGRTLFQGSCELREQGNGREQRFIATMRNGPRYVFQRQRQRGDVWISDGSGGSWPVDYRDYGRAAVFRWSDMSLEARQGSYRGSTSNRNRSLEEVLEQLFN
ncbi:MAG: hypothetical protein ACK55X_10770 [Synechococcaceae cyanobacterium]|jgi:hypothetical protein